MSRQYPCLGEKKPLLTGTIARNHFNENDDDFFMIDSENNEIVLEYDTINCNNSRDKDWKRLFTYGFALTMLCSLPWVVRTNDYKYVLITLSSNKMSLSLQQQQMKNISLANFSSFNTSYDDDSNTPQKGKKKRKKKKHDHHHKQDKSSSSSSSDSMGSSSDSMDTLLYKPTYAPITLPTSVPTSALTNTTIIITTNVTTAIKSTLTPPIMHPTLSPYKLPTSTFHNKNMSSERVNNNLTTIHTSVELSKQSTTTITKPTMQPIGINIENEKLKYYQVMPAVEPSEKPTTAIAL